MMNWRIVAISMRCSRLKIVLRSVMSEKKYGKKINMFARCFMWWRHISRTNRFRTMRGSSCGSRRRNKEGGRRRNNE
ncbi:hypothetical protein EMCG_01267 [[Emmonsia] crescens]|uniref:Uncharacterized protein n=1 Tax=[Emmonsia] crescens TaxID=73230 RepID=A0A0G2JAC3_9EURO|nr:hypothetical protein EMCG_01267 [Emmonsia crescens UAMH 3008]